MPMGSHKAAACGAASREFPPSAGLTEPPPLRELWLGGSTIVILIVIADREQPNFCVDVISLARLVADLRVLNSVAHAFAYHQN